MNKNRERSYSLQQIAKWLEIEKIPPKPNDAYHLHRQCWIASDGVIYKGLPNFYDPQHNWRVWYMVVQIAAKLNYQVSLQFIPIQPEGFKYCMHLHLVSNPHYRWKKCFRNRELATIEALAELKRLEKEGK